MWFYFVCLLIFLPAPMLLFLISKEKYRNIYNPIRKQEKIKDYQFQDIEIIKTRKIF